MKSPSGPTSMPTQFPSVEPTKVTSFIRPSLNPSDTRKFTSTITRCVDLGDHWQNVQSLDECKEAHTYFGRGLNKMYDQQMIYGPFGCTYHKYNLVESIMYSPSICAVNIFLCNIVTFYSKEILISNIVPACVYHTISLKFSSWMCPN